MIASGMPPIRIQDIAADLASVELGDFVKYSDGPTALRPLARDMSGSVTYLDEHIVTISVTGSRFDEAGKHRVILASNDFDRKSGKGVKKPGMIRKVLTSRR